ncbi:MAG: zinc ABC transporter substrate-binding protein [Acidimicrobiia bacterium]|nr:zinc ABC transporter substrate-binding protein [Acidimicrobiia bacterium]
MRLVLKLALVAVVVGAASGCSSDEGGADAGERPRVVVTTNIVGDMVTAVLGDQADVEVVMPLGASPHDFAPSARQANAMAEADLLVVNGAGFEEGMLDIIETAEGAGTPVFAFADQVALIEDDPHIWTDPSRMVEAVRAFGERALAIDGVDATAIGQQTDEYVAALEALDGEVEEILAAVPADQRVLVTNHEVFAYFAERYGFEVVGAVIPSLSTSADASAAGVDALADLIREQGVPAIFAETTQSSQLADALAEAVGGDDPVEVVELFTESLGEPGSGAETYLGLLRTDAERIASALA